MELINQESNFMKKLSSFWNHTPLMSRNVPTAPSKLSLYKKSLRSTK